MNKEYHIGIDIGSTCAKLAVLDGNQNLIFKSVQPTGWSSVDTAESIRQKLLDEGIDVEAWELKDRLELIYAGKMTDAKTVAAITAYAVKYGSGR